MSCPSQQSLSIYVDGELALGPARTLESHLMQCRRCRATVLALRDEVSVLSDVLHGRELEPLRAVEPREQARGLMIGLAPAVGVVALVATVVGWLLETSLPAGTSWLSPIRVMGAYEMVFETVFMLRDQAPALFELAIAGGVLFGVAAILTFLVGTLGDRLAPPSAMLIVAVGAGLASVPEAQAFELRHEEKVVVIEAGETLAETLVVSAKTVRIDGVLEGDLFAMAESIRINGEVDGNVVAFGDEVEVMGEVDGSLYVGAEEVRIEGEIDDQLYGFAEEITLDQQGFVEDDMALYVDRARVDGKVGRDLLFAGDALELRGEVGRNLVIRGSEATLVDGALVAGDVDARMPPGQALEVASGATIGGERIESVLEHEHGHWRDRWSERGFYMRSLALLISAFLVGMLLHVMRPTIFETALPTAGDFFRELGLGFVTLVVAPIVIVICFATVVGIPLGLIGAFVLATGLFVSMIVVAVLLGSAVLGARGESVHEFARALLLGLLIVTVAVNLPFVGGLLWLVALLTGTGMLVAHARDSYRLRAA